MINEDVKEYYNTMRHKYLNREIGDIEWNFICRNLLEMLMIESKTTLTNLKDCTHYTDSNN